ncbi:peroxisomal-coenzyme A synthetase [Peziza echinospora]|nr:peroxisomal-coenzyme A synthetase [Peziza echinospora]
MPTLRSAITPTTSPAIIIPQLDLTLSYPDLNRVLNSFQSALASIGVGAGTAVSIALANNLEFVVSFLAVGAQRAIAAPLNPNYKQEEFEFYIDDVKSMLVIVPPGAVKADAPAVRAARKYNAGIAEIQWDGRRGEVVLELKERGRAGIPVPVQEAREDDVALVLHTSGTTGKPKAVPLTHKNLTTTMQNIQQTYLLTPTDRSLLVMPLFHVHGLLAGLLAPLKSGGTVIIPGKFSASQFWLDFTKYSATWYTAVPTIHQILLLHPHPSPLPKIRFIRSCSSPLSPTTFENLEKAFKAPVLEAYAMTEAAHQMTSNPPPPGKRLPGSVGLGQGVEVAILTPEGTPVSPPGSDGEICIRGPNVTPGYLNNPSANASSFHPNGFFRTGDQGRVSLDKAAGTENYVIITGRIKELINRGGEKISPVELDNVISRHEDVAEAVAFAVESELYGQEVGAAVVLKKGRSLSEAELKRWLGEKVAGFKIPKRIWFTEVMPKTATGKVQRRMIAEEMQKRDAPKAKL